MSTRLAFIAGAAAVAVLMISPLVTRPEAQSASDLSSMEFGWPFSYVIQDQSSLDPPFPHAASLHLPQDYPTGIDVPRLLLSSLALLVPAAGFAYLSVRTSA